EKSSGIYDLHLLSVQSASSLAAHKLEGEILSKELYLQQTQTCNQELQIRLCCRIRWGFRSDYRGWIDGSTIAPTKSSTGIVFAVKRVKLYGFQDRKDQTQVRLMMMIVFCFSSAIEIESLFIQKTRNLIFDYVCCLVQQLRQAQTEAVNLLCGAKTKSNPENTVGMLTMVGLDVGEFNLTTAIQIAQLAFKHCQNKNQRERIIVFAGSYQDHVLSIA
ncbi:unnamed protein product, partial [Brassica napus]